MSIELKNITKVVDGIIHIYPTNLHLRDKEFNVLLGATLSGKTTLLRLMAGLEKPSSGEVWFSGKNVTHVSVQHRNIAMVYQEFINYPNFSVFDNIASPLKVAGKTPDEIKQHVGEIAELLKLSKYLDRDVASLSGGQQQRIALARALVKQASLVLLDEPLANLDYKLREQLREELPRLFAESGSTVVYATSEPEEALMLSGHIATLYEGEIIQYGKTTDIYRRPANLASAKIFSHPPINITKVVKSKSRITLPGVADWPCPEVFQDHIDGEYILGIRPHHLSLKNLEQSEKHIRISGNVQLAEISGSASLIHLRINENDWISESGGIHPYSIGETINVYMNLDGCLYFDHDGKAIH
ncbi:MAG: ABC transporter ATP-binding protein [Gammaproteobacteria bacterium]|nr:ABC transporter ATP-binding protein [Gammaproteobacteria bacterium]MCY4219087.1 ABC transporter ATP-binding protein [Gammaproteobacteria bacterium]MCY4274549.1 ABC transporter ATP-binding protein [Gammaproteobacteria bacterium]